jgi:hypothetical protein
LVIDCRTCGNHAPAIRFLRRAFRLRADPWSGETRETCNISMQFGPLAGRCDAHNPASGAAWRQPPKGGNSRRT